MAAWVRKKKVDLLDGGLRDSGSARAVYGEALAHAWRVTVLEDGAAADLSGYAVWAEVVRLDGGTVTFAGTLSGNVATAVFPGACYAFVGPALATLWLINATTGARQVLDRLNIIVEEGATGTAVDPGDEVESLPAILALLDSMQVAEAARVAAETARVTAEIARDAFRNWRKALGNPAALYPVPQSALTVKAMLTAIQAGSGTPSTTNVRAISPAVAAGGIARVRRKGANLIGIGVEDVPRSLPGGGSYGNNYVHLSPPSGRGSWSSYIAAWLLPAGTYMLAYDVTTSGSFVPNCSLYLSATPSGEYAYLAQATGTGHKTVAFALPAPKYVQLRLHETTDTAAAAAYTVSYDSIQIVVGSADLAFEAYAGTDYSLTAQQALYGVTGAEDAIANDGSEVHGSAFVTLTGGENWYVSSGWPNNCYYSDNAIPGADLSTTDDTVSHTICSHFPTDSPSRIALAAGVSGVGVSSRITFLGFGSDTTVVPYQDVAAFKAWLANQSAAGTPVQVLYKLATPTTLTAGTPVSIPALAQVDRYTPRQNVVTLDKGTAEVGYAKSPIRAEDEIQAAIAALA